MDNFCSFLKANWLQKNVTKFVYYKIVSKNQQQDSSKKVHNKVKHEKI